MIGTHNHVHFHTGEKANPETKSHAHSEMAANHLRADLNLDHNSRVMAAVGRASLSLLSAQQHLPGAILHFGLKGLSQEQKPFTHPIVSGQGPYQVFHEHGLKAVDAAKAASKVKSETGQSRFNQGEQFRINADDSVTIRLQSRQNAKQYTESTFKNGMQTCERSGDTAGNFSEKQFDQQGKVKYESKHQINEDGSVIETSRSKTHSHETISKHGKLISELTTNTQADGGVVTVAKKYDRNDLLLEHGSGPKTEQNYTKSEDWHGNIIFHQKDGCGYVRKLEADGKFTETHYGPQRSNCYILKGDCWGNDVEIRESGNGNFSEKHRFKDASKNFLMAHMTDVNGGYFEKYTYLDASQNYLKEVDAKGQTVLTDAVGLKARVYNASPEFQRKAFDEIRKLPEADRRLLASQGLEYALAGKMSDIDPALANQHPRGWPPGATYNDCDGTFFCDSKRIAITEKTNSGPSERTEGAVLHETGHAIDFAMKDYSHSAEYHQAYDKDVASMSPAVKQNHLYLLQGNEAGDEETFAEIYAGIHGCCANANETARTLRDFPSVAELIRKKEAGLK